MRNIWIIGSSKSIGFYLSKKLSVNDFVTGFSRNITKIEYINFKSLEIDLTDPLNFVKCIKTEIATNTPDAIIFCQRYRSTNTNDVLNDIHNGINLEIAPIILLINELKNLNYNNKKISIILFTSIASELIHLDLPLYYHLLKSNTITLSNYYSVNEREAGLRINTIILGEFLKYNINSYSVEEKDKFAMLKLFSNNLEIVTMSDIFQLVDFLISDNSEKINGQVFRLEGNIHNIAQESIIRYFNNEKR